MLSSVIEVGGKNQNKQEIPTVWLLNFLVVFHIPETCLIQKYKNILCFLEDIPRTHASVVQPYNFHSFYTYCWAFLVCHNWPKWGCHMCPSLHGFIHGSFLNCRTTGCTCMWISPFLPLFPVCRPLQCYCSSLTSTAETTQAWITYSKAHISRVMDSLSKQK